VMPRGAPNTKVKNTQVHGARVVLEGDSLHEAAAHARALASREGFVLVHPYEDPLVIAGQGTVGLELLEQAPDLDAIVVPVGGGGLVSGIAVAARGAPGTPAVYGVESRNYPSMRQRLAGQPVDVGGETLADGIAVKEVGETTLAIVRALVAEVLVVEEETIERAVALLLEIEKTVAEGAGAAAFAALLEHPARFAGRRIGVIVSGGNIDSRVLASVLMRGLVRDRRLVRLRVTMSDVAGSLAKVAALIAEGEGNIVEVQHQRIFGTLSVRNPEVELLVETRDREHTDALVASLRAHGVDVTAC
jgi:threonine dehydratase